MKIKVNKTEYPVIVLEESNIKSNHTDLDIKQYKIEFTIYEQSDKQALSDILSEKLLTIVNGENKKYSIQNSSYSNSSNDNYKSQKYKLEIQEIENLSLDILNIDGLEFKPYFYEESFKDGLQIFSKIKTDKKGFDYINEKKFSSEPSIIIRVGISSKPIQFRIQPGREWSELNGEYKLVVAFSQITNPNESETFADILIKIRNHSIANRTFYKSLLNKLVSKGILEKSESDTIFKQASDNFNKEFIEYHKVKDID